MGYSNDLDKVIRNGLKELLKEYNGFGFMFNREKNYKYLEEYFKLIEENKSVLNYEK